MKNKQIEKSMSSQTFDNVEKLVESFGGADSFADDVKREVRRTRVTKAIHAMRVSRGIPQSEIAGQLNCTQSRISKIENGVDADLRLGELEAYASAFDCDLGIAFVRRDTTSAERIKQHVLAIRKEFERLAAVCQGDSEIVKSVAAFMGESMFNMVEAIQSVSRKLPKRRKDGKPFIRISSTFECDSIDEEPLNDEFEATEIPSEEVADELPGRIGLESK